MMSRTLLRRLLTEKLVVTAGAYDCISAKAVEEAGFDAIYTSGSGFAASYLGQPDVGLYTMSENLNQVRHMVAAVEIPLIADVDTGYGGPLNVARTIREFEAAGCAGVVLEDQLEPKRCPAVASTWEVAPFEDSLAKLHAALDARRDADFVIVARTDAQGEEALRRCLAYLEAGADLVLPISRAFSSRQQLADLAQRCHGRAALNLAGWIREQLTLDDIAALGFQIANYPFEPVYIVAHALRERLPLIRAQGTGPNRIGWELRHEVLEPFVGFGKAQEQVALHTHVGRVQAERSRRT